MRLFAIRLTILLAAAFVAFTPPPALAADCTCFCATSEGAASGSGATPSDCAESCTAMGGDYLVCATDSSQYPGMNVKCFTEQQCKNQNGKWDENNQPPECPKGMYYCYPDSKSPIPLSTDIEGVEAVFDYGEFIQLIYRAGLGMAVIIAIVFVMVGGLQYVLAAGTGNVEKAKARIRNAVAGLVLLLCVFIILYTVNPRLVILDPPKFPMIRRVELIGAQSCEYLLGVIPAGSSTLYEPPNALTKSSYAGISMAEIEPIDGKTSCGFTGSVTIDPKGVTAVDGSTCSYEYCEDKEARCVGEGDQAKCMKCTEVYFGNSTGGLSTAIPTAGLCKGLTPFPPGGEGDKTMNYCFYTNDPGVLVSGWALVPGVLGFEQLGELMGWTDETNDLVSGGACASMQIDCNAVSACTDYDSITVTSAITSNQLKDLGSEEFYAGTENLKSICSNNPCRLDSAGNVKPGMESCEWVDYTYPFADSCEPSGG